LHLLALRITLSIMSQTRTKTPARTRRPGKPAVAKVAITVRLEAARAAQLQALAAAENRTLTNYVETALLRDLAHHDEADRVITMYVAPGLEGGIEPEDVIRGPDESDEAYARRQALMVALCAIPDNA
jgi:hypothetical protein